MEDTRNWGNEEQNTRTETDVVLSWFTAELDH